MILKINEITRHLDQNSYFYIIIVIITKVNRIHDMSKSYSNKNYLGLSLISAGGFSCLFLSEGETCIASPF